MFAKQIGSNQPLMHSSPATNKNTSPHQAKPASTALMSALTKAWYKD